MRSHSMIVARKMLNLYRSAFAINGKWGAVNQVFINEYDDMVMNEIAKLPCGLMLNQHIINLKSGKTPMNSIDSELLPYNGMMYSRGGDVDEREFVQLTNALKNFQPDAANIAKIKALPVVRRFGDNWAIEIRKILHTDSLIAIWRNVVQTDNALRLWDRAVKILAAVPNDILRAEVQADMLEYETYLPMFGQEGTNALSRLRQFIS